MIDERKLSNSRKTIRDLSARIVALEKELEAHRSYCNGTTVEWFSSLDDELSTGPSSTNSDASNSSDNMIVRLCGGQRQLNSDRVGRLRFFGPTSSLHLSESVTSSVLIREPNNARGWHQWQEILPLDLQAHLMDLYWKYQHQMIPIIHKEGWVSHRHKLLYRVWVCANEVKSIPPRLRHWSDEVLQQTPCLLCAHASRRHIRSARYPSIGSRRGRHERRPALPR